MFYMKNWEEYTYYLLIYLKEDKKGKFRSAFFQLHRNDQLRFFNQLEKITRNYFYECMDPEEIAPLFAKLSIARKKFVAKEMDSSYERKMMLSLPSDEIVRYLKQLTESEKAYYLSQLPE